MDPESCPKLYQCQRVRMTPMIRVLLKCTAAEAMERICADCDEWVDGRSRGDTDGSSAGARDSVYTSPTGEKIMVMIGDGSRPADDRRRS